MKKTILTWDECDIRTDRISYLQEEWRNTGLAKKPTEDEALAMIDDDTGLFEIEWDFFKEVLDELIQERNKDGNWRIDGKRMGWRNLTSSKQCHADTGEALLEAILPKTDTTIRIYDYWKKRGFHFVVSHHDSPMGEDYYVRPIKQLTE